jgi:hypothetical protein
MRIRERYRLFYEAVFAYAANHHHDTSDVNYSNGSASKEQLRNNHRVSLNDVWIRKLQRRMSNIGAVHLKKQVAKTFQSETEPAVQRTVLA